jgi:NADH-quinone oxidoreductase subunit M
LECECLIAIIAVYIYNGATTFDIVEITSNIATGATIIPAGLRFWLWMAFALAFFIKVPLFPLHTWLLQRHVGPTAGSMISPASCAEHGNTATALNLPLFRISCRRQLRS